MIVSPTNASSSPEKESLAPESISTGRIAEAVIAVAIGDVRECLLDPDCRDFQDALKHAVFARARELASEIGNEPYGGMAVFGNSEEQELELIVDSVDVTRRLSVTFRAETARCQVAQITGTSVVRGGWVRQPYDIASLARWLISG